MPPGTVRGVWREVVPRLGVPAVTVELPSCGPGHGDMHDDAAEIRRALDEHSDVVLVGHSYSGIPVTEAAAGHPSVSRLVYVASYNADLGETLAGFEPPDPDEPNIHPDVDLEPTPDGLLAFRTGSAVEKLFHDCPDPWGTARLLRPIPPAVTQQAPRSVGWKDVPSDYVVCTRDRATSVRVQRRLSGRADRVFEIDSGHSPFLARPQRLADILTAAATA